MASGPGKYDDLCTYCARQAGIGENGGGVIVIVLGGNRGNGFSAQLDALTTLAMPELLEEVARQLREGGGTA